MLKPFCCSVAISRKIQDLKLGENSKESRDEAFS